MTVIRNFGVAGVANTIEFGKQGGTLNYDNSTKVFSFALSSALTIPSGTNTQRPTSGTLGMLRVNTESAPVLEMYNGSTWQQVGSGGSGSGSVTTVSIVTLNGFTGTVSNPTTTPAITLGVTVEGLLKGSSGTLIAASTTTDYQVPVTLTTIGPYGPATFDGKTLNIPTAVTGVTQIIAGTNVSITSSGTSGTGIVTVNASVNSVANLAGGQVNEIPFQSGPSTTTFSSKLIWNDSSNILQLGDFGSNVTVNARNASGSFSAGSLTIRGGNASVGAAAGTVTVSGGAGITNVQPGGNLILQGGQGDSLSSGDIVLRTSSSGALIDRLRILANGAWSIGNSSAFTGAAGQVLTSQGGTLPPVWANPGGASGVTQILAGTGITVSPGGGTGIVTINATASGGGTPGGVNGQLQWNNAGSFSGTTQLVYSSSDTLTVGAVNSTFNIVGIAGSGVRGANITIKSGDQITGGASTRVTIAGGNSQADGVAGGSVFLEGGTGNLLGTAGGGSIVLRTTTGTTLVDRVIVNPSGAVGFGGANYGTFGQVLTSQGPNSPPIWIAGGGGGGTGSGVTLVAVSGGTTGLTTIGGPITSTGTITLTGTLAISAGGTGLNALPGSTGSLFFNNNNTLAEITGLRYDGASNLYFNSLNITTEDNFSSFTTTNPLTIKPGAARNNTAFAANLTLAGGDSNSTINRAGSVIVSGGVNSTASRSGFVILQTNNLDRFTISESGAYGVPGSGGPAYGSPGDVLTSQGPNSPPVWQSWGGGGTGTAGVIAVTASAPISSTGGNTPNISLSTVPANLGGTGYTNYTTGDILWADGATSLSRLNIGSAGQVLAVVNGRPQWAASLTGVQSFSGGSTGLTPSSATTGIITLAGRLNIGFGGTGANNKADAFNNLAPTNTAGDIIYFDASNGNIRLPIGSPGTVLTVVGGVPTWQIVNTLPTINAGNKGYFLSSDGSSSSSWSSQIQWSGGNIYDQTKGRNITIQGLDGDSTLGGWPGGNVLIRAGNNGGSAVNNGGGIVTIQTGINDTDGYFNVRNSVSEFFRITRFGSWSLGSSGTNTGASGQILVSQGSNSPPTWITPSSGLPTQTGNTGSILTTNGSTASWTTIYVSKIVAGNSNIIVSPNSGTGEVTLSVVGSGFQGVSSFSAGSTGFSPSASTTGAVVLTGTLLTTSGGTGFSGYAVGDILYASSGTALAKLPIGGSGQILTSNGSVPTWQSFTGLPAQSAGTAGLFLASNGASGAGWNSQIFWSGGSIYDPQKGRSLTLQATDGDTNYSGYAGGNILIRAGNNGGAGANSGGGIVTIQTGINDTSGYFNVRSASAEFFRITRFGSWSLGSSGTNTGAAGQILVSQGPSSPPIWTSAGAGLPDQTGSAGYFLTTNGVTASWTVIAGGTGSPGGSSGQLQWNNGGAFAGTNQITYAGSNTLTLGVANTFNIVGSASTDGNSVPGSSIVIRGGLSGSTSSSPTGTAGDVTIQGGIGKSSAPAGFGGNVFINGGTATSTGGYVSIGTGASTTERLRFLANGAWALAGITGTSGQALVSTGATTSPEWRSIVTQIVAGSNITISPTGGTGTVTISSTGAITTATTTTLGGIKVGDGLAITSSGTLSVTTVGGVSSVGAGNGIAVSTSTGAVVVTATTATLTAIGAVKIGSGLAITADGTLSVVFPPFPPEPFELAFAVAGKTGSGTIWLYTAARAFTIPANATGAQNYVLSPATTTTVMQLYRVTTSGSINNIGFITYNAGQSKGVISFASSVSFSIGDTFYTSIASADASLGDISLTIPATLN